MAEDNEPTPAEPTEFHKQQQTVSNLSPKQQKLLDSMRARRVVYITFAIISGLASVYFLGGAFLSKPSGSDYGLGQGIAFGIGLQALTALAIILFIWTRDEEQLKVRMKNPDAPTQTPAQKARQRKLIVIVAVILVVFTVYQLANW